jgi:hypothetical protein
MTTGRTVDGSRTGINKAKPLCVRNHPLQAEPWDAGYSSFDQASAPPSSAKQFTRAVAREYAVAEEMNCSILLAFLEEYQVFCSVTPKWGPMQRAEISPPERAALESIIAVDAPR